MPLRNTTTKPLAPSGECEDLLFTIFRTFFYGFRTFLLEKFRRNTPILHYRNIPAFIIPPYVNAFFEALDQRIQRKPLVKPTRRWKQFTRGTQTTALMNKGYQVVHV